MLPPKGELLMGPGCQVCTVPPNPIESTIGLGRKSQVGPCMVSQEDSCYVLAEYGVERS